jgi:hypothetical protein
MQVPEENISPSEMTPGDFYFVSTETALEFVFRFENIVAGDSTRVYYSCLVSNDKHFKTAKKNLAEDRKASVDPPRIVRKATSDEANWLATCYVENKYLSFDEARHLQGRRNWDDFSNRIGVSGVRTFGTSGAVGFVGSNPGPVGHPQGWVDEAGVLEHLYKVEKYKIVYINKDDSKITAEILASSIEEAESKIKDLKRKLYHLIVE